MLGTSTLAVTTILYICVNTGVLSTSDHPPGIVSYTLCQCLLTIHIVTPADPAFDLLLKGDLHIKDP